MNCVYVSVCVCVCSCRIYLCARHNREEVKGRGSLGPVGIHGARCRGVLDDWRWCDGRRLRGLFVTTVTVSTVDEFQMQHLCLKLADGAQLGPPRHAIGSSPHMALQRLEGRTLSVKAERGRERQAEGRRERLRAEGMRRLSRPIRGCSVSSL